MSAPDEPESPTPRDGRRLQSAAVLQAEIQTWTGPLPPPAALRAFEDTVPGSAVRILDEFQREAEHRRALEERRARLVARETHIGQALAIVFALSGFGVAGYAVHEHAEWIGSIVGGGVIVSGIVAFLRGRRAAPKDESD